MNLNVKIFHLKRKPATVLGCLLAAAVMFAAVNAPAVVASATQRQFPIYCVQRDQKMISISFDAAWGDGILRERDGGSRAGKGEGTPAGGPSPFRYPRARDTVSCQKSMCRMTKNVGCNLYILYKMPVI